MCLPRKYQGKGRSQWGRGGVSGEREEPNKKAEVVRAEVKEWGSVPLEILPSPLSLPIPSPETVRTATPFPMVSLFLVFTAFVISNIGHIRPQRTILAFVSGIFFILSGEPKDLGAGGPFPVPGPVVPFPLTHFLAVWPGRSCRPSLSPTFLLCAMEIAVPIAKRPSEDHIIARAYWVLIRYQALFSYSQQPCEVNPINSPFYRYGNQSTAWLSN